MNTHVVGAVPRIARGLLCLAGGLLFAASSAQAQRQISGRVVDADGNAAIPAAAISVAGTTIGTVTNDSGAFHTKVPAGAVTLNVRRIGYKPRSVPLAADQGEVVVALTRDVLQLEATVITGAATTISSRNSANDVPVLNADQVNRVPSPTIENAIQGKIPGALVEQNNGGAPGGGLQVQVRGITSINANANPLYIVDGVAVNNETINSGENAITGAGNNTNTQDVQDNSANRIADINPNDIESIEVLKGASAAAIYGSRAGSGVIIITTKKGNAGKAKWDLTGKLGTFQIGHTMGFRDFPTLASATAWCTAIGCSPSQTAALAIATPGADFQKQFAGGGQASYEGDLSVRGQSGQTQYYASVISKYDNGIQQNTGYNKQGGRINLTQQFSSALSAGLSLYYQHSLTQRGISGNDNVGIAPYDIFSFVPQWFPMATHTPNDPTFGGWIRSPFSRGNVFADAHLIQTPDEVQRFIGGANLAWKIFTSDRQDLTFTGLAGSDLAHQADRFYSPRVLQIEQSKSLPGTVTSLTGDVTYVNYNLNLVHHWAGGSNFDATTSIGMGRDRRQLSNPFQVGQDLPIGAQSPQYAAVQNLYDLRQASKTMSFYGQEQIITLDQRLTLSGGVTAERSTNNGNINHYYTFPKVSASFRIPQFVGFLDELKLRGAYGRSGTDPIYGVRYPDLQNLVLTHDNGLAGVYTALTLNDPNVKPETNTEIETGFDATMFNSRAQLTFTVYQKRITDLLLLGQVAPTSGTNAQWFNGGQFTNKGAEVSLAVTPIQMTKGLTWISTTTFARNYSHVDSLPIPAFAAGNQFGGFFGTFWVQQGQSVSAIVNTSVLNSKGQPKVVGNAQPGYSMSFGNELSLSRLHLYGLVDWRRGGQASDLTASYFDFAYFNGTDANNILLADTASATKRVNGVFAGGVPYMEPATYLKVREITLSFDVPDRLVGSLGGGRVTSARVQVSARNPFVSYPKWTGLDPEVSNFGNSNIARAQEVTSYPSARSWFFTLDLGF